MKISPKKPHFFKPILPGFNDGIKIPDSFFKYVVRERYPRALLRTGGKEWRVKINDQFLREGWSRFAIENNLEPGDFVVFGHEGNMVFEVLIFDRSQCEREDSDAGGNIAANADSTEVIECPSKKLKSEGSEEEVSTSKENKESSSYHEESDYPHFFSTIKPYSINHPCLYLPFRFARSNGLLKKDKMILINKKQMSWTVRLQETIGHFRILSEWVKFRNDNGLKEGDADKFELIKNGKVPVGLFTVLPRSVQSPVSSKRKPSTR